MRSIHCLAALLVLASPSLASDWPQFQGPAGDGTSKETGLVRAFPESGPRVLWSIGVEPGYGGAAVRDGEVYFLDRISGEKDVLLAVDLKSGEELWRFENETPGRLMYPGSRGVPTVTEGFVYAIGGFGHLYCIDRKTHEAAWILDVVADYGGEMPMFGYANSPLVLDDLVIVAPMGSDVGLLALDRKTGDEIWTFGGLGSSHSTPVVLDLMGKTQILFVSSTIDMSAFGDMPEPPADAPMPGSTPPSESEVPEEFADFQIPGSGLITALSPGGDLLWQSRSYYCSTPIPFPVKIDDEHVFFTGGYDAGSVLLRMSKDGSKYELEEVFRTELGGQIHIPMVVDDHLYLLVNENSNDPRPRRKNGGLMCMDLEGKEKWRTGDAPYFGRGNMILADGILIIQDGRSGFLRLVEPTSAGYQLLAEANIFDKDQRRDHRVWAPMALAGGHLLMRSQEQLKCVSLEKSAD